MLQKEREPTIRHYFKTVKICSKNAYKQLWIFHVRLYFFLPGVLGLASQSVPESVGFITFSHCDWLPHRLQHFKQSVKKIVVS
nr:hypothetical protein Iba_chr12aCG19130 [Ipomoea batatas]